MKTIFRTLVSASAALALSAAVAQDEELDGDDAQDEAEVAVGEGDGEGVVAAKPASDKIYHLMPMCRRVDGVAEVMRPSVGQWQPVEEGRFYPLGCSFRTVGADSRLAVQFGPECEAELSGGSAFGTLPQPLGSKKRVLALINGTLVLRLPMGFPEGALAVTAPGFSVESPAGESRYDYALTGDGDEAVVRCVTGRLGVKGRHFEIPAMRVANEVKIRTSQDNLFTALYGTSGDYVVRLDQGLFPVRDFETGETKVEAKSLDWHLSPQTAVRIHRAMPAIGSRMSVTIMTFDAAGALRNRCAFAEGRPEINTGEQGDGALEEKEDLAKKAAEASETEAVEADVEDDESSDGDAGSAGDAADDLEF